MREEEKMNKNSFLDRERNDVEEFLEILKKVPEKRKGEVLGIVKGFALGAENSEEKAG